MNVLILAPHPDDESIGCGGAVSLHVRAGDGVSVVYLTSGELGLKDRKREEAWAIREAEARAAAKILRINEFHFLRLPDWMTGEDVPGAAAKLAPVLTKCAPELVYLPHPAEWHPDHKASLPIMSAAIAATGSKPRLFGYEVWTPMAEYQHVRDITGVMSRKVRAIRKHASQVAGWDYVRAVRGLNAFRGVMAGRCLYAEVFQQLEPARS